MEIIRNYLEGMFANLPNTAEVQKAKHELFQMMEDKYTELINDGKKENEAVGIVISEFGNLDEIAESLGIDDYVKGRSAAGRRHVTREEAGQYIQEYSHHSFLMGLGVMLCIMSPGCLLFFRGMDMVFTDSGYIENFGGAGMFLLIAAAVFLFIYSSVKMKKWDFLKNSPCSIDYQTAEELYREQGQYRPVKAMYLACGVVLCFVWLVPAMIFAGINRGSFLPGVTTPVMLFVMIGIGVMLIIFSNGREKAYIKLLSLNDSETVSGNNESTGPKEEKYINKTAAAVMSCFWHTVLCIYLIWSFITFKWYMTWIIWPVAAVIHGLLKNLWSCTRK